MQIGVTTKENGMEVPKKKLKIEVSYDSAITLLGICSYRKDEHSNSKIHIKK